MADNEITVTLKRWFATDDERYGGPFALFISEEDGRSIEVSIRGDGRFNHCDEVAVTLLQRPKSE